MTGRDKDRRFGPGSLRLDLGSEAILAALPRRECEEKVP